MSKLVTGRKYELHDTPDRLRAVWAAVKGSDPKAVIVLAESDNVGVIGTDVLAAVTIGKLDLD